MKLDKTNVCVFIEDEAHLQQARELLGKYEEDFEFSRDFEGLPGNLKFIRFFHNASKPHWFNGWQGSMNKITLSELEEILKGEKDGN